MIWNALRMAVTEIARNLTRSLLTALGILIGVAAVIAMVGLGQGATASIEQDLSSMGQNLLILMPGGGRGGPGPRSDAPSFTERDAQSIQQQVAHVMAVAPTSSTSASVVYADRDVTTTVHGSTREWLDVLGWELEEGRLPELGEQKSGAAVCLIGETVRADLFDTEPALGAEIRVDRMSCQVIGVFKAKGANTMGMDQDDLVFAPLATVQRRLMGSTSVASIYISVDQAENITPTKAEVETLMRQRRNIPLGTSDNFGVHDTRQMAEMVTGVTGVLTMFLGAVAGVSLLVGGIGIMNIMLVSVTERTKEIGIRMAIGALERDVLTQFLVEAALLSALGGLLGVIIGVLGAYVGSHLLDVPFVFNPLVTFGALAFSALVGLGFGWYPARRAARLEPIDALRR